MGKIISHLNPVILQLSPYLVFAFIGIMRNFGFKTIIDANAENLSETEVYERIKKSTQN